ncbi:unnamed protein product, partial [Durusdinium trenchii]
ADECGLSEPWVSSLKNNGVATFAKLSFAITSPGTVASDDQVTRFMANLRPGVVATIADLSAFKRILFESQTLMIHRFKSAAKGDDLTPKRMPAPERDARLALQRQHLRGLDISGPLEPAHSLYDMCAQMVERNEVAYISPSKCLSRQQELMGAKPEKELQLDASKTGLIIKEQPITQEISLTSDLALFQAMQRRALAMDLANLATYEVMKKWVDRMFAVFSQPAAPGFSKISQAQLLRADRQAFVRLSETFTGSLKVMPMAGKPLDPMIEKLENDVSVTYFMLPAEYTPQLAKALATTILEAVAGTLKLTNVSQVSKRLKLSHFHAIAAGKQPTKMTSLPTALGDVDSGVAVTGGAHLVCNRGICARKEPHLKLERLEIVGDCNDFVFGVRWSPEQFLEQAVLVGHPFREFSGLLPEVKLACEKLTSWSHEDLVNWRCKKLGEWLRLAKSLQGEEKALKDRMPEARRRILERKRVALMRHLIRQEGYDDHTLADDIEFGFNLVGDCPKSSVLPSKLVPATISKDDLRRHSAKASKALRYMTRSSGDVELDAGLWTKTMTEVEKGWLIGPIPWETLPVGAAVSRRFPLSQAGKVRPIDDLSQSQVNSTVNTFEQATVDGPDVICSLATYLMRCLVDQGRPSCLKGRSLDLASAYRQLAIADESLQHSFLSVYDPEGGSAKLFQQVALPFGSRSAVNAFIRCARFLQWIAAKVFILPLTCYFDDFVAFSMPSLCNNSQSTLCLMLDILGWRFDREGPKSDDFSESVSALGVLFDLTESERGILRVCNTTKRINDATLILDDVLSNGRLVKKDALSLRGKLAFCDAFIFGRVGKLALQDITKHAYANPFVSQLSERLVESLRRLRGRLVSGSPRVLTCKMLETFFLFTDASFCRSSGGGFGAFLAAPDGAVISWFGIHVEAERFARWFEQGRQTSSGNLKPLLSTLP